MSPRVKIAFVCYVILTLGWTIYGLVCATASQIMPHHQEALGVGWDQLEPRFQEIFLTFLHAAGTVCLAASLSMWILLFIPFRKGERWALWAAPIVAIALSGPPTYFSWNLAASTGAAIPWKIALVLSTLVVVGFILSVGVGNGKSARSESSQPGK